MVTVDDDPPRTSTGDPAGRQRRAGSESRVVPFLKPFVLPILMWPAGPLATDKHRPFSKVEEPWEKTGGPPKANTRSRATSKPQVDDASVLEVLERIRDFLITDKSGAGTILPVDLTRDKVFKRMKVATQRETIFELPKPTLTIYKINTNAPESRGASTIQID